MNTKGFLGILNNLDMLSDKDIKKALNLVKPSHLAAALRNRNLRQTTLQLLTKQPKLMTVLTTGDQELVGQVEKLAQSKDGAVARLAIQVLGKLPQRCLPNERLRRSSLRALNPEVKSTAPEKKRALLALGVMRDADAVNLVRHTAKNDRLKSVRDQAWVTLASMGQLGQRQLIAEARSQARRRASTPDSGLIKALGLVQGDAACDLLTQFQGHEYLGYSEGRTIVRALIEQGTDRSFKCLADVVCRGRTERSQEVLIIQHLAKQNQPAASRALLRIARRHGRLCDAELIQRLGRMPGTAVTRFLLEKAVNVTHNAEFNQTVINALVSRRDKQTFNVLRDMAMTGSNKEAQVAKRIIRKRGETDKLREQLLANL